MIRPRAYYGLVAFLIVVGCAELELGVYDPEMENLQLTMDILKSHNREAQRTITGLRGELEGYRKNLAEARMSRARLDGRLRETERRYADARRIVDWQREELARTREERGGILNTGLELQSQLRQLQQQLTQLTHVQKTMAASSPAKGSNRRGSKRDGPTFQKVKRQSPSSSATTRLHMNGRILGENSPEGGVVYVRSGDTLWDLARHYDVVLDELIAFNNLRSDLIYPGQALKLPPAKKK